MTVRETDKFKISLIDARYFYLEIKSDVEMEVEDLEKIVEFQGELGGHKQYPVLTHPSNTANTNSDLLKHMAKKNSLPYTSADAFIITSIPHKILAKLYTKINPPERPTAFFSKKEEALKWLEQFF